MMHGVGMIGGAPGSFMGDAHRRAIAMTGRFTLVAGCLSGRPEKARAAGAQLGLAPERCYDDWAVMARAEAARAEPISLAVVVTPNDMHLPVTGAFLDEGIKVFCEKPLCIDAAGALAFAQTHATENMALAYTYTGYAMVREARRLVREGELGRVRNVQVEYLQDWLDHAAAPGGWRLDARIGGAGGCLGDIGTHAFHLAEFVSGLTCSAVSARVSRLVQGRSVPDDAAVFLDFQDGCVGGLWVSQVATGCGNALRVRLFGTLGSLEWAQERPDELRVARADGTVTTRVRGASAVHAPVFVPRGHPEGYLAALARLYDDLADRLDGQGGDSLPGFGDGLRGVHFVETALASGQEHGMWRNLPR